MKISALLAIGLTIAMGTIIQSSSSSAAELAALKAPDFTLTARSGETTWMITATAPAGHHFNIHAPMSLRAVGGSKALEAPAHATEKKVQFKAPKTAKTASYVISLYLCDDAKTFCEKHEVQYSPQDGQSKSISSAGRPPSAASSRGDAPKRDHGFILNDPTLATAEAKRENKPLIIDFFGIWCPPCNQLDEKVFNQKSFQKSASHFVKLKLDADSPVSWELKSKYRVTGYPTVVFASADGDEISRVLGFRPLPEFTAEMDEAWKSRTEPLSKLEKLAARGDRQAADRAGVILYNRGKSDEAAKLLVSSKEKREFWHLAEIDALENRGAPANQQIARINQAIAEFPKTPNTIDWYGKLADLYGSSHQDGARRDALQKAVDLSFALVKEPGALKGYDATIADLLESEADYREQLDGKDKARADWLLAAKAYEKQGVGPKERANNLEMAFCLWKGGEYAKSRAIYDRLENVYPSEFTFYFNHARLEQAAGNLPRASELAHEALEKSYGDNRLRVVKLVAEIYQGLGQKDQAKKIIDETLAQAELPQDPQVRTHRYADDLKKLRAEL